MYKSMMWIIILSSQIRTRMRINYADPNPDPDSKNQSKPWETHLKIDKNHRNIIFQKQKLHFCLTHVRVLVNDKLIQSTISHFLEHINFYWKKSLQFFGIYSIVGRDPHQGFSRPRIRILIIALIKLHFFCFGPHIDHTMTYLNVHDITEMSSWIA